MHFKMFAARTRRDLEKDVNDWLEKGQHVLTLDNIRFQYSAVSHDDNTAEVTEHLLVVFYEPFKAIR